MTKPSDDSNDAAEPNEPVPVTRRSTDSMVPSIYEELRALAARNTAKRDWNFAKVWLQRELNETLGS